MLFLLILLLTALVQLVLPWWAAAVVPFGVAIWRSRSAGGAFGAGFCAVAILWLAVAGWHSHLNDHMLASRMAGVLPLGGNAFLLIGITALLGGIVGGIAAWAGYLIREVVR